MSRSTVPSRVLRRTGFATTLAAASVLLTAVPALAHVEVESEGAQALAQNVKVSFDAESESTTAGITELRVVLPQGIAPGDVKLAEGPKDWQLTADPDGYTVKGPAIAPGKNAQYAITVRQLPDAAELAFKTLQTYSDKRVDRWIEVGANSESPAPVLKLKPAAQGAKPAAGSTPSGSPTASAPVTATASPRTTPAEASAKADKDDDGGLSAGAWTGIGVGAVVLVGAAVYFVRRRSSQQ
ncbi:MULTISPECIES: DUF1775 domain-containing protein [unclassified Streptomyces]|uniref:DUF1775 domain-containing protein n=1 Tax=Streptomyces sp. NBC_00060 TaxID=2975636 RepID=A0AAU2GVY0_9ACTN